MLIAAADPLAFDFYTFITTIVVCLVVVVVLGLVVWPKILKGLDERDAKILHEIESAEAARASAMAKQKEFEHKLAAALEESDRMLREARAAAIRLGDEIRAKNESELADRARRAGEEIENARRTAVAELEAHASSLAIAIAGHILEREIAPADQKRLVEQSLAAMNTPNR